MRPIDVNMLSIYLTPSAVPRRSNAHLRRRAGRPTLLSAPLPRRPASFIFITRALSALTYIRLSLFPPSDAAVAARVNCERLRPSLPLHIASLYE